MINPAENPPHAARQNAPNLTSFCKQYPTIKPTSTAHASTTHPTHYSL